MFFYQEYPKTAYTRQNIKEQTKNDHTNTRIVVNIMEDNGEMLGFFLSGADTILGITLRLLQWEYVKLSNSRQGWMIYITLVTVEKLSSARIPQIWGHHKC